MKASAWTWRRFHSQSSYMPFAPSLRSDIEFRIIGGTIVIPYIVIPSPVHLPTPPLTNTAFI